MEYKSTWLKITDFLNPLIVRVLRTRNYVVAWMQPSGRFCPRRIAVVACCIILSISLLLGGLGFGVYSLFFANPEDVDQDGYAI
ncbi:MAG: hypothetical protein FWG82_04825, partial [Oscillospiraceae bacterium]|nr:hypothetical protein [Oscillospiraceae bacterium]